MPAEVLRGDVAYALIVDEERSRILMVRNENGAWSLPGGMREPGETLREAAVRETREEAGLDVTAGAVVHMSERIRETHDLFVTFRAHITTPATPISGDPDIQEVAWIGVEEPRGSCPTMPCSTSRPPTRAGEASSGECRGFITRAPEAIHHVWSRFHGIPMETFAKG